MRKEAERWLKESLWDLETAKILHDKKRYNAAAFYAHQAAEKAAKALLFYVNEAPWGHSIRELLERFFEKEGKKVEELMVHARELDRHYIPSRYPDAHPSGTPHEAYDDETAKRAIRAAEEVINFARKYISE